MILPQILLISVYFCGCGDINTPKQDTDSFMGLPFPDEVPVRFAEDIITDSFYPHSKLIITPADDRIYWTTFLDLVSSETDLYYSDFDGEYLSVAKIDTTLAEYDITNLTFLNDDNSIIFGSLQPYDEMDGRLVNAVWTSTKTGTGWSRPQPIEATVDTNWVSLGSVSINSTGDIYFSGRLDGETAKIYRAKYVDDSYQKYEPLPGIINTGITLDPFIDFQDEYLLFAAAGKAENIGIIDLYISFKDEFDDWSQPENLGEGISTQFLDRFPMVTRDGKYLFFVTSNSDHFPSTYTHYYWVDAQIIERHRPTTRAVPAIERR